MIYGRRIRSIYFPQERFPGYFKGVEQAKGATSRMKSCGRRSYGFPTVLLRNLAVIRGDRVIDANNCIRGPVSTCFYYFTAMCTYRHVHVPSTTSYANNPEAGI